MLIRRDKIDQELNRMAHNCQAKRSALLHINEKDAKKKKLFMFSSGTLSIFSAILLTVPITNDESTKLIQILSVIFAALGGLIAIATSLSYNNNEVSTIHLGAARFLALRETINRIKQFYILDEEELIDRYNQAIFDYNQHSETYDKYIPLVTKDDGFGAIKKSISDPPPSSEGENFLA
jgi:hypothetical protein